MGWTDRETAKKSHRLTQKSHYISCWSRACNSVAMWSLYSQDFASVRISTKITKLKALTGNIIDEYSFLRLREEDLNKSVVVCVEARIAPVDYKSLDVLSSRVQRRLKAFRRIKDRYLREGKELPKPGSIPPKYFERKKQRQIIKSLKMFSLKDNSFEHEKEVRIVVRLGEEPCDEELLALQGFIETEHPYHSLIKSDLALFGSVKNCNLQEKEFVNCPNDFIENIAIDPRCPAHKEDFMRNWFQDHGIKVVKSNCFGYIPDSFDVFPSK